MLIDKVIVGDLKENCYILTIDDNCIVIDPGDEYEKIDKAIKNKKVLAVIITHKHFDHVGALPYFSKNIILDYSNLKERVYKLYKFIFEIIYTPGHKEDSICIYFKEYNAMFTGDFIFKNSIGRTDLLGGNYKEMLISLDKIKKYDDNIIIYPGHGESTVLGKEKENFKFYK